VLYEFVASNYPVSIVIALLVGAWAYRNRSSIQLAVLEEVKAWRVVSAIGVVSTVLLLLWVTVLDNWRQLLGYWIPAHRRWMADPIEAAVTPDALRYITLALVAVSIVSLALVYGRYRGPYSFLVLAMIFLPVYAYVFNQIRIRADVFLRQAENSLRNPELLDTGFVLFWTAGLVVIIASVVLASYLMMFAVVALPVRFVSGLVDSPSDEGSAKIFDSYGEHAGRLRGRDERGSEQGPLNHDATVG
jgi:hypothetical protein